MPDTQVYTVDVSQLAGGTCTGVLCQCTCTFCLHQQLLDLQIRPATPQMLHLYSTTTVDISRVCEMLGICIYEHGRHIGKVSESEVLKQLLVF